MKNIFKTVTLGIATLALATTPSLTASAASTIEGDNYYYNNYSPDDYSYSYNYKSTSSADDAALGGLAVAIASFAIIFWLIGMTAAIITLIANWKVFTKAGQEGWKAIIPIYNIYVLTQIAMLPGWYILLLFIPIANAVATIYLQYKLAQAFGKDVGFAIGLILLNPIFILILAFSKDIVYIGNTAPTPGAGAPAPSAPTPKSAAAADPWVNNNQNPTPQA